MMAGDSLILLLINKKDTKYDEEKGEDVPLEDPITRWKNLLGPPNPEDAKTEAPESLHAVYGVDAIKNGFTGSDDAKLANKERDIFKFAIPEKIPEFKYEKEKVTLDHLFKFVFPSNLEHSDSTG